MSEVIDTDLELVTLGCRRTLWWNHGFGLQHVVLKEKLGCLILLPALSHRASSFDSAEVNSRADSLIVLRSFKSSRKNTIAPLELG